MSSFPRVLKAVAHHGIGAAIPTQHPRRGPPPMGPCLGCSASHRSAARPCADLRDNSIVDLEEAAYSEASRRAVRQPANTLCRLPTRCRQRSKKAGDISGVSLTVNATRSLRWPSTGRPHHRPRAP